MISIVLETPQLVVVDKPAGVLSVPSRLGKSDPRICLGIELQNRLNQKIYPVHRLDFEVSGLVVFAKNPETHRKLQDLFESRRIKKIYQALSSEEIPSVTDEAEWKSLLLRGKKRAYEKHCGKPSLTLIRRLSTSLIPAERTQDLFPWELRPLTGRPHQLRYEMYKHGAPILGDRLYGSTNDFGKDQIALRAVALEFSDVDAETFQISPRIETKNLWSFLP